MKVRERKIKVFESSTHRNTVKCRQCSSHNSAFKQINEAYRDFGRIWAPKYLANINIVEIQKVSSKCPKNDF